VLFLQPKPGRSLPYPTGRHLTDFSEKEAFLIDQEAARETFFSKPLEC